MNVLFLYTSTNMCRDGDLWYYDEAAAVTAACLRNAGHVVHFRTVNKYDRFDEVRHWVDEHAGEKTVLVFLTSLMFSALGHDVPDTFERVAPLKRVFGFPVAAVGIHATVNPEETIAHPDVDYVGRGEMEEALVEFCDALEAGRPVREIANFWVKEGATIHRNPVRPLVNRLDALPFPARDLLPRRRVANERDGILTIVSARGCPMQCNFCTNPVIRELYRGGKFLRMKSVDYLIEEIRSTLAMTPDVRAIFFQEDIFGLASEWTDDFLARYTKEIGLPWGCNLIIGQATPAFAAALRRAGCRQVQFGVESGNEYQRNTVLNRGIEERQIYRATEIFREAGIHVAVYAMMGLPGETLRQFAESVRNFARYRPDMIQIQVWQPLEGSNLLEKKTDGSAGVDRGRRQRKAWRLKFLFHYFHRMVAIHQALDARRKKCPVLSRLGTAIMWAALRFPWTPDLLLARDWEGDRRRFPALWIENRVLRRLASRFGGRFWKDVREREIRLAALYLWPVDLGTPPTGRGWFGEARVDQRQDRLIPEPEACSVD